MKALFICLLFALANIANSQPLLLYKTDGVQGKKYVLSRTYQDGGKSNVSEVIIADTFSIQLSNAVCQVTMSNAYVFRTELSEVSPPHSANKVVQNEMFTSELKWDFPKETKLIFNNSVTELSQAKLGETVETNTAIYEDEAALQELKKMGLKAPEDMKQIKK